jgi:hypothetical protein
MAKEFYWASDKICHYASREVNMDDIVQKRMTAEVEGDFVVFLIGMRINKLWKIHKWLPVALAMPKMLTELYKNSQLGFMGHEQWMGRTTIMVQYWKSFEHLERYAKDKASNHLPAWADFNKKVGSNGDVGIWHESYLLKNNNYECVYNNMPVFGLAKATNHIPVTKKNKSARDRLNAKII